jgi:hypothetical protein
MLPNPRHRTWKPQKKYGQIPLGIFSGTLGSNKKKHVMIPYFQALLVRFPPYFPLLFKLPASAKATDPPNQEEKGHLGQCLEELCNIAVKNPCFL